MSCKKIKLKKFERHIVKVNLSDTNKRLEIKKIKRVFRIQIGFDTNMLHQLNKLIFNSQHYNSSICPNVQSFTLISYGYCILQSYFPILCRNVIFMPEREQQQHNTSPIIFDSYVKNNFVYLVKRAIRCSAIVFCKAGSSSNSDAVKECPTKSPR